MPVDCEMLVSHSATAFAHHSPPLGAGFLADCSPPALRLSPRVSPQPASRPFSSSRSARLSAHAPPSLTFTPAFTNNSTTTVVTMPVAAPRRPCLVVRPEDAHRDDMEELNGDLPSPTRLKKKVVFADDKGLALTQVRVMTEPSNAPPVWSLAFLEQVTRGICADAAPEPWEVAFAQPASDYLRFRHRLDTTNVSLENVIVRESEEAVVGTVKVRNLCFRKEVLVRSSADAWSTQEDAFCQFVQHASPAAAAAVALYDTFSFRLTLAPRSRRIEFCVCFRCEDGREFWDNNDGDNYILVKKGPSGGGAAASVAADANGAVSPPQRSESLKAAGKCNDALYAKVDAWSEFASWNHLVNDGPYW